MGMMDILLQQGAIDGIARDMGIPPAIAKAGVSALLPGILGGFQKNAAEPKQADQLGGLIGALGGGGLLDAVMGSKATPTSQGNDILGQIFGSKDVSRQVAAHAETKSGVSSDLLKKMLPILAMVVSGYLAKQAGSGSAGGLGGMLGQILGGGQSTQKSSGGLGGLASMLDFDGDGNPLDDILGMATRLIR